MSARSEAWAVSAVHAAHGDEVERSVVVASRDHAQAIAAHIARRWGPGWEPRVEQATDCERDAACSAAGWAAVSRHPRAGE